MERLVCLLIGYAFGLIQTSYIYGRIHHIDIREHGSGNAGTTNALRTLGKKAGIIVFLGDVLKVVAASFVVRAIFGDTHTDSMTLLVLYSGFGTVLGHNFPCYLKFKGGKGIAATAGVIISLACWQMIAVGLVVFIATVAITRYVSLGSLLMVTSEIISFAVCIHFGIIDGVSPHAIAVEAVIIFVLFGLMAVFRHKENVKRLVKGTENKIFSKKN